MARGGKRRQAKEREKFWRAFDALSSSLPPLLLLSPSLRSQIHSDAVLQLVAERKRGELSQPEGQDLQLWPTSDALILLMPSCNGTCCLGRGGDAGYVSAKHKARKGEGGKVLFLSSFKMRLSEFVQFGLIHIQDL